MNTDLAISQKEFIATLASFEKAPQEVIRSALSLLQQEPNEEATLTNHKIGLQAQDPRIQALLTKITTLAPHPEIKTWILEEGYDSLSAMANWFLEHALWNHIEAKVSLDLIYNPLILFLKGSDRSSFLSPNSEEAYRQLAEKIDQRLEELQLSPPQTWTQTEADKQHWKQQLQTMKKSWLAFKERVQTFPKALLFSPQDNVRKEEYLKLAWQFGLAFTGLKELGKEHLLFLQIPEFLQTCRTGWDTQIRQMMSMGRSYAPSDSATLSALEASREVRRSLLEKALQKAFLSHANDVHYQTAAKYAGNELFSLGYSLQELGPFEDHMISLVKNLIAEPMLQLLDQEGPQELILALIQRYPNLPNKENLFTFYLDAYEEEVQTNQSLIIDPCTKLESVFTKLKNLGKVPTPTKEFWQGLQECFYLCQEAGIPSPGFSTKPQFEMLIESSLKRTAAFQKHLKSITKEDLLRLIEHPEMTLQKLVSNACKEEVTKVLISLQEPLNALKQSLSQEAQEKDFEAIKKRALAYAATFSFVRAKINRSRLENLLSDRNKLTPFGAYAWGLSSRVLKIQDGKEAQNTKVLQWMQRKNLPIQEQETLLQLLQARADQLLNGPRKEKIKQALKTKDLNLIQTVIHTNIEYFILEEIAAFGDVDSLKRWLKTHILSESERGQAVRLAAKNGHLPMIQELLQGGSLSEEDRKEAIYLAAGNGHLPIVQGLLKGTSLSERDRGIAIYYAAQKEHLAVVQELLKNGSISQADRGQAVRQAALKSHIPVIQELSKGVFIMEEILGLAVKEVAEKGCLAVVQELLKSGSISEGDRGQAIRLATENGHLPVVQELLQSGSISEGARVLAIMEAIRKEYPLIIRELLKSDPISKSDRGYAVMCAAKKGHLPMIQELLQGGSISENDLAQAVAYAADKGHYLAIQKLLKGRSIPQSSQTWAVMCAARKGHHLAIQELLKRGPISKNDRGQAVMETAENNHLLAIQELLKSGPIAKKDRRQAVMCAAKNNHPLVMQELLQSGSISENDRSFALQTAQGKGFEKIVEVLKNKKPWWKFWGI